MWDLLSRFRSSESVGFIHVILDNSGFEFLTDLVFVGYLLETGYANSVVLHGKCIPWFISDVNEHDLGFLVEKFRREEIFTLIHDDHSHELRDAGLHWQALLNRGILRFHASPFWTAQHSYGRMPKVEPALFRELANADLVIFKGDLNYWKLMTACGHMTDHSAKPLVRSQKDIGARNPIISSSNMQSTCVYWTEASFGGDFGAGMDQARQICCRELLRC